MLPSSRFLLALTARGLPRPGVRLMAHTSKPEIRQFSCPRDREHCCIQKEGRYTLQTYGRAPIGFERGEGVYIWDCAGNKYLDFTSGIAVTSLGHSHPTVTRVLSDQAAKLMHTSNIYYTSPPAELAERLVKTSGLDRAFFCNSGTEANEAALKFARRATGRTRLVGFRQGFHGRSCGALAVTHKPAIREQFMPLLPEVAFGDYNDVAGLQALIDDKTAGVIVETVQGEGGVRPATQEFLLAVQQRCAEVGAVLIIDEVQTGLARTGPLFAHFACPGLHPDIVTLAKPLANGLPIGAVLVKDRVAKHIKAGDHGTTFGGNPLACAVANAVFDIISAPAFLERMDAVSRALLAGLQRLRAAHPALVKEIRSGLKGGMLIGVDVAVPAEQVIAKARERGLLLISAGPNTLRLAPPLILSHDELSEALTIMEDALASVRP